MEFKELAKKVLRYNKNANLALLEKAYHYAQKALAGKKRHSGQEAIHHAIEATYILADLKVDDQALAACLLHQVLENGSTPAMLKREFGEETTTLVEGVSQITRIKAQQTKEEGQSADIRKMLLAAANDVRVIMIKLCDKLHNMRTLDYVPDAARRQHIAREVLDVYAPLAYRLGMGSIKSELEDLAFKHTNPEDYAAIIKKIIDSKEEREYRTYETVKQIKKAVEKENIPADVTGRVKHVYGIYRKVIDRHYNLDHMNDLVGIRIIVNTLEECYNVLRIVHTLWTPIPGTFKDYIAMPKQNGYQSLHTVIKGIKDKPIEFQIRTHAMHETAEEGIAIHYGYKGVTHGSAFDKKLQWLKQLLEQKDISDKEFVQKLKLDFFSDTIYVFTPKGKVIELTKGATPLDFAYAIHSDLGDHCTGAMINNKYSSIKAELNNGDVIEIITAKTHHPSTDWLKIVKTIKARTKIRQYLRQHGMHVMTATHVQKEEAKKEVTESLIDIPDVKDPHIKIGICCKPLPGEKIIGFRTGENKINVHRSDCNSIKNLRDGSKKEIKAQWRNTFHAIIELIVDASDRVGLLAEVLNTLARQNINVDDAKGKALPYNKAEIHLHLQVHDTPVLLALIERIKKIKDVHNVYLGEIRKSSKIIP